MVTQKEKEEKAKKLLEEIERKVEEKYGSEKRSDSVFGNLEWDGLLKYWKSSADLSGLKINISIDCEKAESDEYIKKARDKFSKLKNKEKEIKDSFTDEFLELYNGTWRDQEKEIGKDEFLQKIKLNSAHFLKNGSVELYYEDGGLFGDHEIVANIDSNLNFKRADLAG